MSRSKSGGASSALTQLSNQLVSAIETVDTSVVAIHARRRIPSSGIVWRDGIIVSASHTVRRDEDITITLPDGATTKATIAGRDPVTDLIALRMDAKSAAATKADAADVRVGALALAVGRPGRHTTASFGIISAIAEEWRTSQGTRVERALRLDLAVYDGFSGGPLVSASGAVIGVNNSALARGAPMALPADVVDRVLDQLLDRGYVARPFIGVAVQPVALPAAMARQHKTGESALLVTSVAEESPAEKANVFVGDVLTGVNGRTLRRPTELFDALAGTASGESLTLELLRGGVAKQLSVTPADRGAPNE